MDNFSLLYLGLLSYLAFVLKEIPRQFGEIILNIISFTFSTTSNDGESYSTINEWLFSLDKKILNNNLNAKKEYSKTGESTSFSINYGKYYFFHNKCLVFISKDLLENAFNVVDKISVRVIGLKRNQVKKDILELLHRNNKTDMLKVHPLPEIYDNYVTNKKSFDDIFIEEKNNIIQHLDNWLNSREIYQRHGIVYKTGVLLYGAAGTGKTTTAKAIASYLGFNLHIINIKSYKEEQMLIRKIINIPEKSVVLFEDIDCLLTSRAEEQDKDAKALLGTVLNILDGVLSPENVVFVGTTNHIDSLDEALIREGRFDLKVNAEKIGSDLAEQMCYRFGMNSEVILKDEVLPINPAYLQNKILKYKSR